jgi:raffinose/stachyose/melibiose transport system permease protein
MGHFSSQDISSRISIMDKTFKKLSVILMFILPAFIFFFTIVVVSIIWVLYYSFFEWNGLSDALFVGLNNYIQMLRGDVNFWPVVFNTFTYTALELLFQVGGGLIIAIFLTHFTRARVILQTLYYIPVIISSVALCQIFNKLLSVTPPGVINHLLSVFNKDWIYLEWISNPKFSLLVAAFVEGFKYFGLYMVIFYAALIAVPKELSEAATIDGASTFRQLWHIKLPYIFPVIISNLVLVLNGSMRSFDISYLLTKGGPGNSSQLLAPYMYKQAFSSMRYGYGCTVSVAIVVICILIGIVFQKLFFMESERNSLS